MTDTAGVGADSGPGRIVLHACCGPCATVAVERLLSRGVRPILLFSNSNLDSAAEYGRRRQALERVALACRIELVDDGYDPEGWEQVSVPLSDQPERPGRACGRCRVCIRLRLDRTAAFASREGIEVFSTSLTVSPYKHASTVFSEGQAAAGERSVHFLAEDWKKRDGHRRSLELSTGLGLYRQNYCGCRFSLSERFNRDGAGLPDRPR